MVSVEEILMRLDGVKSVSAGWKTDAASVAMEEGQTLEIDQINRELSGQTFKAIGLELVRSPNK